MIDTQSIEHLVLSINVMIERDMPATAYVFAVQLARAVRAKREAAEEQAICDFYNRATSAMWYKSFPDNFVPFGAN